MNSSTVFILLAVFLVALSISVANAGEEKEEKKEGEEGEKKEGEEGGEKGEGEKSGAFSAVIASGLPTVFSLVMACLIMSHH